MRCLGRLILLFILVVGAAAGWLFLRDDARRVWYRVSGTPEPEVVAPSEELAADAATKLDRLASGEADRATLSSVEAESLLLFRYGSMLPGFIHAPRVVFDDGRIRLSGRIPIDRLPSLSDVEELEEVLALMPDTTSFEITTQLIPLDSGRAALALDGMEAARIPLPKRLAAPLLRRLGRRDEPGLPADAVAFRLPAGAGAAYVRGDSLVLMRAEAGS